MTYIFGLVVFIIEIIAQVIFLFKEYRGEFKTCCIILIVTLVFTSLAIPTMVLIEKMLKYE